MPISFMSSRRGSGSKNASMPGITTALYQQYGAQLNWMIAVNDLYFDFAILDLDRFHKAE